MKKDQLRITLHMVASLDGMIAKKDIAAAFLQEELIDEIRMMILPVVLGNGVPFFNGEGKQQALHLKDAKAY